jgi:hypothetical protein
MYICTWGMSIPKWTKKITDRYILTHTHTHTHTLIYHQLI